MEKQAKTRRERIDAALDAMGAAVEEIIFYIDFYLSDLAIHLICDERRYLDEIDGATFFQLAKVADDENA